MRPGTASSPWQCCASCLFKVASSAAAVVCLLVSGKCRRACGAVPGSSSPTRQHWDWECTCCLAGRLQGRYVAGPPPQAWDSFARRWQDAYARSQPPARFAALAYDAVALAATQARLPAGTRFTPDALANPSGFAGGNGIFRFGRDGVPEHALAILQVTPEGNIVLDPAAESFTAAPGL